MKKFLIAIGIMTLLGLSVLVFPVASIASELQQHLTQAVFGGNRHPISDAVMNLSARQRANIKGQEIAKIKSIPKIRQGDYWIEVQKIEPIEGGVQVFVRAWDSENQPIGFGSDGSVEIERFRIINPPILVNDNNGDIVQTWTDDIGGEIKQRKLREDLNSALLQSIVHTISVKKEKFGGEKIKKGKIGNTTTTVYPDHSTESTSVDGGVTHENASWSTAHDASTGAGPIDASDDVADDDVRVQRYETGGFFTIRRLFFLFDTSSIPDVDTISSAVYSVYVTGVNNDDDDGDDWLTVVQSSPASNTAIISDDYDQCGAISNPTEGTSERKDLSSISTSGYLDISLNSTGRSWISKTGVTKLGLREGHDVINSSIISGGNYINRVSVKMADQTGSSNDPTLVIEHSEVIFAPASLESIPSFSAIFYNSSTTALATSYQLQITPYSSVGTWTTPYWDSGKQALSSSTPVNQRTPSITSTSTLVSGQTYFWRVKFWNQIDDEGMWSTSTPILMISN